MLLGLLALAVILLFARGGGYLAFAYDAELAIQYVASPEMDGLFWRERDHRLLRRQAAAVVGELAFRVRRLGVRVVECPEVGDDPAQAIVRELGHGDYQLQVLGALDHGSEGSPRLGRVIRTVLSQTAIPTVLLIAHEAPSDRTASSTP
jgi:nucleotide-binding universal stress UspA family protein